MAELNSRQNVYEKVTHITDFTKLESSSFKLYNLVMCNLYTKFVSFLEICKKFSNGLVTDAGNFNRPGPVPRFSDLEIIALSMAAESEGIDSENWLFEAKQEECRLKIRRERTRSTWRAYSQYVGDVLRVRSRTYWLRTTNVMISSCFRYDTEVTPK